MSTFLAPFIYVLSFVFELSLAWTKSPGLSILALSLAVTILLLPIQWLIDWNKRRIAPIKERMRIQEEEIERCYSGQTKHLYLKTLYRQHNFHPANNFISLAVPLFQIPFFLAAYNFLSGVTAFKGIPFLFIKDLGQPDQMLQVGGLFVNFLPLLMTTVNLLNVELVEKSSEKRMLRIMALFFLFALYKMPAALVLYWTMNNLYLFLMGMRNQDKREALKGLVLRFKKVRMPNLVPDIKERAFVFGLFGAYCLLLALLNPTPGSNGERFAFSFMFLLFGRSLLYVFKARSIVGTPKKEALNFEPVWCLFALCTVPVFHYAYGNMAFLSTKYLAELILYLLVPTLIFLLAVRLISRKDFSLVFTASIALTFFLTPIWLHFFKMRIEDGFFFQMILLALVTFALNQIYLKHYRLLVNVSLCLFLVSTGRLAASFARNIVLNRGIEEPKIPDYLPKTVTKKPDVYFLIYDAYVDERFLKYVGVDNSSQWNYLKSKSFQIYNNKLSLKNSSLKSISLLYNFGAEAVKSKDERFVLAGHNPLDKYLKSQGYETYYMAKDYFFRGVKDKARAKILIPQKPRNTLLDGILQGEFKFETISKGFDYDLWKSIKKDLFQTTGPTPKWVYAHSPFPAHTQNSGVCLPNEVDLYKERLEMANKEMQEDIENILKTNPNSIIITAGDHGAYFLGDCFNMKNYDSSQIKGEHIVDRYGVHIAIRWPEGKNESYDFDYLQGVFHSVVAYMTQNKSILAHQPQGKICLRDVCTSRSAPIDKGPDAGKLLFESF